MTFWRINGRFYWDYIDRLFAEISSCKELKEKNNRLWLYAKGERKRPFDITPYVVSLKRRYAKLPREPTIKLL